jgi:hypothetical protein
MATGHNERIALIEPHDGTVSRIVLSAPGAIHIEFSKLYVYEVVATDRFEIWLYSAVLELRGVTQMSMDGEFGVGDHLDDVVLDGPGEARVQWKDLLHVVPANSSRISFGSGASIAIACSEAQLSLMERIRHVEDWIGPL